MARETHKRTIVVDLERCLACRSCEWACALAHAGLDDVVEAVLADEALVPRVRVIAAAGRAVPIQCQQCEDAPCVAVCPSGALYLDEEDGSIRAVPARCIGCKACVLVCPFGAAEWDANVRAVVRCDLCADVIEDGDVPRCVAACPTHARHVVSVADVAARRRKEAARRTIQVLQSDQADD